MFGMTKFQEQLLAFTGIALVMGAAIAFMALLAVGVIPETAPWNKTGPTPVPTATPIATPSPSPALVLLGGEDRRACGYLFTTFEWAVVKRDSRYEDRYWFTNDRVAAEGVMTLRGGCSLDEEGQAFFHSDQHKPFDVMQFRLSEFGDGKHDFKLYHNGVQVRP
ncbi:hypothetical protein LCGC14_1829120 [marine sediment metagenome]|uniref:Uncharacterized protein n=1 Tax=marine sediment metagenome TaxID=412755 RepID=A0A0F9GGL3_9ZZZZ